VLTTCTCSSRDSYLDEVNVVEYIVSWSLKIDELARQLNFIRINIKLVLYSYIESSFRDNQMGECWVGGRGIVVLWLQTISLYCAFTSSSAISQYRTRRWCLNLVAFTCSLCSQCLQAACCLPLQWYCKASPISYACISAMKHTRY